MAWWDDLFARMGRRRIEPRRDTALYPKLFNIGGQTYSRDRPMIKPTPANLRKFAKTVYARRAIKAVKDPLSMLDWEIGCKDGVETNSELEAQIAITKACFESPNRDDSFSTLVEQITEDMLIAGAGVFEHQIGGDENRPLWMWPVDALSIQIVSTWDGDNAQPRYYQSLGYGNVGGSQGRAIRNDELVYIRVDPSAETPFGLGPIEVAFATINRLLGVQTYAGNVASNATPETLLWFKGLDPDSMTSIRTYWQNEIEGQGKTPLFGADAEASVLKMRGADDKALFLEFQVILIREICAAVGVSPQNVGIEADVNRNTSETAEDRDWRMTIIPTARRIAAHLNREVIDAKLGYSQIEFRWRGLDREDEAATADILTKRYQMNSITANEARDRFGLPPMEGPWGDLTWADVQIAISAARGAKVVDDDALNKTPALPAPKPKDR